MEADNRKEKIDRIFESALRGYGSIEPRMGLENRVLGSVSAKREQTKTRVRWWPMIPSCAAMLIISIGIIVYRKAEQTEPVQVHQDNPAKMSFSVTSKTFIPSIENRNNSRRHVRETGTHRTSRFPSPRPLSVQEQLLLAYLRATPADELERTAKMQGDHNLALEKIEIPALAPQISALSQEKTE